jgi:hypothetical protein
MTERINYPNIEGAKAGAAGHAQKIQKICLTNPMPNDREAEQIFNDCNHN